MLGNVYCGQCGKKVREVGRYRCECPVHGDVSGNRLRVQMKVEGQWLKKRFTNFIEAVQFLESVRVEIRKNKFDIRDYRSDEPLGFSNLANEWLEIKKEQVKARSWNNLNNYLTQAGNVWGNRNIKEIQYADIEDFLFKTLKHLSSKSRSNARSALHDFMTWLVKRRVIYAHQCPELPEVSFELAYRNTVEKPDQERILDEIKRISWSINPRIWIAAKWLATYFSIRPSEMFNLKEGEINREHGFLLIPHPKEKRPKAVPLIDEDIEMLNDLPRAFPDLYFFRHIGRRKGIKEGTQFAPDYVREWWNRACENLGIKGVDFYGGTRHSTVIALGEHFTPEQLKAASFHSTNKAFERYFRVKPDAIKDIYQTCRTTPSKGKGEGNKGVTKLPNRKPKN